MKWPIHIYCGFIHIFGISCSMHSDTFMVYLVVYSMLSNFVYNSVNILILESTEQWNSTKFGVQEE